MEAVVVQEALTGTVVGGPLAEDAVEVAPGVWDVPSRPDEAAWPLACPPAAPRPPPPEIPRERWRQRRRRPRGGMPRAAWSTQPSTSSGVGALHARPLAPARRLREGVA